MNTKAIAVVAVVMVVTPLMGVAQDKVELKLNLPKPMFVGTPKELKTPNLERKRKGKRKPLKVAKGVALISKDKGITGSDMEPIIGDLELITDGDKEGADGSYVELGPGKQYVQIDLEKSYEIHALAIWHFHSQARVYNDVIIQSADDPDFITNVQTIFNADHDNSSGLGAGKDKDYIEGYEGKLIGVKGVKAQYIRLYSNGSTSSEMNHYIEVEVYGK